MFLGMRNGASDSFRLFFACELPGEMKERLLSLKEGLRRSSPRWDTRNWRWVDRENLHLTVRFLGETPGERLEAVMEAGREAAAGVGSFSLSVGGLGFFPPRGAVRVVWVGVGESAGLLRLRERLEEALFSRGFVREEREFHPHLTLARAREPVPRGLLRLEATEDRMTPAARGSGTGEGSIAVGSLGTFQVRELVLFRSVLHPAGPEYHRLAAFELASPSVLA